MVDLEEFRIQVREWLEDNCPESLRTPTPDGELIWGGKTPNFTFDDQRLWFERMRDKNWFCPTWAKEYGGAGLSSKENSVLESEMRKLKCRPPQINLGIWMLGPVLLKHGTEQQKQQFLKPMARGEVRWCQGFSEPNAGSDLASLRTSAQDMGDHYLVNGSKIWTSYGDKSDFMYALVRTDPAAPKHQGISLLLLDMHSDGVKTAPIHLISGKSSFCEVFFDNVKVPKDNLVGELNGGWQLAKELLQHERSAMSKFGEFQLPTHFDLMSLFNDYMPAPHTPSEQSLFYKAVEADMQEHAYNLTVQRLTQEMQAGINNFGLMSIMKLVHTEQEIIKFELLLDAMGYRALGWEDNNFTEQEQAINRAWLNSFSQAIAGGSSEVQLNIIAKRVLQLPENKGAQT
ncbi:acyl-CoA dehydrogenase family protein [Aliiglaciecola lipolytica]|uniref:Acyl-CoA dehydrogenase-like protein n=1 Tax=Aliiglaciecola lipolytica E3 TaxID=1127673 RepID=K6X1J3_9ALTE|nr:acyl-CoA dehydrogenase family protein [Aliiglaciecola lipolytica]GAC14524.1 acyl-CoA dehydrogenase-like protein [Aliiglaciecola lipolytica E3]